MDEISSLDPGETVKRVLQVCFQHHLLPLKLAVLCNNKKHSIKLWPDIGYFMRPLTMNMEAFLHKESQLPGMFECMKRLGQTCTQKHVFFIDSLTSSLEVRNFVLICEEMSLIVYCPPIYIDPALNCYLIL